MTLRTRESIFWSGILNDIRTPTETCTICQESSKSQLKETQQQTGVPLHAWKRLDIDIFRLNKENHLVVVDYHSRFPVNENSTVLTLQQQYYP